MKNVSAGRSSCTRRSAQTFNHGIETRRGYARSAWAKLQRPDAEAATRSGRAGPPRIAGLRSQIAHRHETATAVQRVSDPLKGPPIVERVPASLQNCNHGFSRPQHLTRCGFFFCPPPRPRHASCPTGRIRTNRWGVQGINASLTSSRRVASHHHDGRFRQGRVRPTLPMVVMPTDRCPVKKKAPETPGGPAVCILASPRQSWLRGSCEITPAWGPWAAKPSQGPGRLLGKVRL